MKIISLLSFIFISVGFVNGQNNKGSSDDAGRIVLNTYVSRSLGLADDAKRNLENKLNQIATKNGMGGFALDPRFVITANVVVLTKDITPTAPPMQAYTLEVTLYVGDAIDGTSFSSYSMTVKGVGNNETKAYNNALKNISVDDPKVKAMLEEGKGKIIEYYNSKCDFILREAQTLSEMRKFDEAIYKLVSIPEVCKSCYDKAMAAASVVFMQQQELECQQNLTKANAAIAQDRWNEAAEYLTSATPDLSCYPQVENLLKKIEDHQCAVYLGEANGAWSAQNARLAMESLMRIPSDSKCAAEAEILRKSIYAKTEEKDKREWDLAYEKFTKEHSLKLANIEVDKLHIEAMRQVGIERAKNQPQQIVYKVFW